MMPNYLRMSACVGICSTEEVTPPQAPNVPAEENNDKEESQ